MYQVVYITLGFLLPRLYLENFGSEVNGVLSAIKQIFTYLILLEAGTGLATVQALYKPVAEGRFKESSAILAATKNYYIKTGFIYSAIVLVIAVIYSFVIPTNVDSWVVFSIVVLTGVPSLFSYFIVLKYRILMEVDGRKYVITNSETAVQLISSIGKILVLVFTDSLILIQVVYCAIAVFQMLYLYIYAKRRYKWINLKEKPDYKAVSQKKSVLVHQLSSMVFNNTDIILVSAMCDFKVASVYTVYNMFFTQVQSFITSLTSSFTFALGQMFHTDRKKFDKIFSMYETFYILCSFVIFTLMAVFLLPIIQIYTDGIDDAEYTNAALLLLFVLMRILSNGRIPVNQVMEFAGKFKDTRSHAIIEMVINIGVSVVAIMKWGVCGAIVGTIAALLFRGTVTIHFVNKKLLERGQMKTYKLWIINSVIFALIMAIFFVDSFNGLSFGSLVLKGIIHAPWIVGLYVAVNFIFQRSAFRTLFGILKGEEKI
jgi:O-antigen/teichoic acid export membrane protein